MPADGLSYYWAQARVYDLMPAVVGAGSVHWPVPDHLVSACAVLLLAHAVLSRTRRLPSYDRRQPMGPQLAGISTRRVLLQAHRRVRPVSAWRMINVGR
jgi:hypothetical protein